MRILSGACSHSSRKPGLQPVLPSKKGGAFQSAQPAFGTPSAVHPGDAIRFSGSSQKRTVSPEQQAIAELKIPYQFKVYRRQKDDAQDVVRNYMPRTIKPENLPNHLRGAKLIALGDLHGSYQKLVETLMATGLATMPPESAKRFWELSEAFIQDIQTEPVYPSQSNPYRHFVFSRLSDRSPKESFRVLRLYGFSEDAIQDIVQRQHRYQKTYKQLSALIQQLKWTGQPGQQLLLIGDVLSDRGPLDFITLDVIDQIRGENPDRLITLASNHDHAGMQTLIYKIFPMGWTTAASLGRSLMMASEDKSRVSVRLQPEGERVHLSLRTGWNAGSQADFLARYKRYVAASQLVYYRPESQTLFTHAPINPMEVSHLNDVLSQRYLQCAPIPQTDSKSGRTKLSDVGFWQRWANRFWQTYAGQALAEKSLKDPVEDMLEGQQGTEGFLWCRDALTEAARLPFLGKGVQALVHGHDLGSEKSPFSLRQQLGQPDKPQATSKLPPYTIFNLDQVTRKTLQSVENHPACSLYVEF